MLDLERGLVDGQGIVEEQVNAAGRPPSRSTRKSTGTKRPRRRQNTNLTVSDDCRLFPTLGRSLGGGSKNDRDGGRSKRSAFGRSQNLPPDQEDVRAQFYNHYRDEAEEYDREFMKKYDEDLNTTLIFAGLFSAVTSAFIILVHPQLQPDPNDETAALLRVLIYTINSTALGGGVPTVPQWSGPPHPLVQVQALLYASLTTSLFSAFLAMLGKQWLNRFASVDMRGSAIERSQNRQRKINGIVTWRFDQVMESLPLMLQVALLLLCCALSRYLWAINVVIASVIIGVTTFGVIFYLFIVVAGSAYISCPYQTPGAQFLRYLWLKAPIFSALFVTRSSAAQDSEPQPDPEHTLEWQVTALDFRCVSWMLQTSLDRTINELSLKFLGTILTLPGFSPAIVADCLNTFISCVSVTDDDRVVVMRGLERLAEMAVTCLLGAISHTLVMHPTPNILEDVYQRYRRVFPSTIDLQGLPFYHTLATIHHLIVDIPGGPDWHDIDLSIPENISLVHNLVKVAWYQKFGSRSRNNATHWTLHFSLYTLLRDPEPPLSVVADCLSIIGIDMGCNISRSDVMNRDKSACLGDILSEMSLRLQWMCANPDAVESNREPVATLFLWAIRLKIADESPRFDARSHDALHRFLDLWDQIHWSDPGLGVMYSDVLLSCLDVDDDQVTERPGLEQAARVSSLCLLRALSCVGRAAMVDEGMFERYVSVISPSANFEGITCRHTMGAIHALLIKNQGRWLDWPDYKPRSPEYILFASALANVVHPGVSQGCSKVPRWILRFVLHSLSQDPSPPSSVGIACLSIIAIELGCDIPRVSMTALYDMTSVQLEGVSRFITQKLEDMVEGDLDWIYSKRKALTAFFPHVILQEEEGQDSMLDTFLQVVRASARSSRASAESDRAPAQSGVMWCHIEPLFSTLLDEGSPVPLKRAAILASPHIPWWKLKNSGNLIQLWAVTASAVPCTDDISQSVVDTLLQIARWESLPIPVGLWSWLNTRPDLPPFCSGRCWGTKQAVFQMVRALGDLEILTSYLLLVWSEWDFLMPKGFGDMCASIREDFGGEGADHHREELLRRLGHVLAQLELGLEHIRQHKPSLQEGHLANRKQQYGRLKEILMEVDEARAGARIHAGCHSTFMCAMPLP